MKTIKSITLLTLLALLLAGCGSNNHTSNEINATNATNRQAEESVTSSSKYTEFLKSNANGIVDMSAVLSANGYGSAKVKSVVEVKNSAGEPLADMKVVYAIDKENDKIDFQISDPAGELTTLYQHLSLVEQNTTTQKATRFESPILLRFLSRAVLRSLLLYDTASTIRATYDLFNVEIDYEKTEESVVFEGEIVEFYTAFDGLANATHLPFALSSNIIKLSKRSSAKGAIKFNNETVQELLLTFLQELGGYAMSDEHSKIRVTLHKFDKVNGFFSIELLGEKLDDGVDIEMYDIVITQNGDLDHKFDHPLGDNVDPEFKGRVVIRNISYDIFKGISSYSVKDTILNVPLSMGEKIEIIVIDKDLMYDDDISRGSMVFNGVGQHLIESEFSTTKVEFVKSGEKVAETTPKYDLNISIKAVEGRTYDIFGNAPDFTGTISISGENFYIEEEMDSFVNNKTIKDVPIKMGEDVIVNIIDKDIVYDDDIIKFSFVFDGKAHHEENRWAKVDIGFEAL